MVENLYTPDCIRTVTGKYVNVREVTLDMICIEDIAHALSMQTRFGGHLPMFYSVAEHCYHCAMDEKLSNNRERLSALLHDASEAYLMDIPSPIKKHLTNYKSIEDGLMDVISKKFDFDYPMSDKLKEIDAEALVREWHGVMLQDRSDKYFFQPTFSTPKMAKQMFLTTFQILTSNEK